MERGQFFRYVVDGTYLTVRCEGDMCFVLEPKQFSLYGLNRTQADLIYRNVIMRKNVDEIVADLNLGEDGHRVVIDNFFDECKCKGLI